MQKVERKLCKFQSLKYKTRAFTFSITNIQLETYQLHNAKHHRVKLKPKQIAIWNCRVTFNWKITADLLTINSWDVGKFIK